MKRTKYQQASRRRRAMLWLRYMPAALAQASLEVLVWSLRGMPLEWRCASWREAWCDRWLVVSWALRLARANARFAMVTSLLCEVCEDLHREKTRKRAKTGE